MRKVSIAIIGGTGFYEIEGFKLVDSFYPKTYWGYPSDEIKIVSTTIDKEEIQVAFLARHGKGHRFSPSEIPQRANLASLKLLGVEEIFAFSAVGSLKEEIRPGDFVVPNSIINRTFKREDTFYEKGLVVHIPFGDAFCPRLEKIAIQALKELSYSFHTQETLVCIEGPSFSTRAESKLYKSWGAGIINMSTIPEAKLARELEICYQLIALSTDYDAWREKEETVTAEEVLKVLKENVEKAKKLIPTLLSFLVREKKRDCICSSSLKYSILRKEADKDPKLQEAIKELLPQYFS